MGTAAPIQTNFNGGELSPSIEGRVDINKYTNGSYHMRGFVPLVQGPARRRSGTRHVAEVKDHSDRGWLVRFQFSNDVAFVLEFGDQFIRFYTNHGQLLSGGSPYEVATPWAVADLTKSDGTFALWMEQSGDVIYITHPDYPPQKLTRIANTNWTIGDVDFKGGPFIGVDPDETRTVYASAASGAGITLTASAAIFTADHVGSLFLIEAKLVDAVPQWEVGKVIAVGAERRSDGNVYEALNGATTGTVKPVHTEGARYDGDTGVQWQYLHSGYGIVRIDSIGGGGTTAVCHTVNSVIPSQAIGAGNPTTRWSFHEFTADRGYPSHVTFFRERLSLFRRTQAWLSVAADFENFANRDGADVTPDMAISINFASEEINDVAWVVPSQKLLVGTVGNEFAIGELTSSDPLGPANIQAQAQTAHGSRQVRPIKVNDSNLFVQKSGRKLREIRFTFESDGYATVDLTVLADHVTKGRIVQMAYQQEPHSIVWSACNDGSLIGFTFNREQDVLGWHPHPVGGNGIVESVACIPSPDGSRDELWMIVRRTINGATKRYIEYMERDWIQVEGSEIEEAFFVDSGLTYDGAAATVISGLDHLEGETVQVLADGSVHPDCVVTGGSITLQREASIVQAGLQYETKLTTMRLEAGAEQGTAQGRIKRITKVVLRLLDTLGGKAGRDGEDLDEIMHRSSADPMDGPPAVVTGDTEELPWPDGYEREGRLTIVQEQPLPMTIVAIMPIVSVQG